jgi:UPF0755 protein
LLLALLIACIDADAPLHPGDAAERIFEIPAGASARGLGPRLVADGLVPSEMTWKMFLRSADGSCIKAGRHAVRGELSLKELLAALCANPLPEDVPFTVVEGWRIREIDAALAAKGWIAAGVYADLAQRKAVPLPFEVTSPTLEGYLYPETYLIVPSKFSAEDLIERQLGTFRDRFLVNHPDGFGARSLHDVVVVASMLEREEPRPTNRPLVAGVIWKRLDRGWELGIDATSRYTLADWNDRDAFLALLKDPADPYGTRVRKGLPPTAIGNPAVTSLEAAAAPVASEYWYYLHDRDGNLHPAVDAAGHEANRTRYGVR